MLFAKSNAGKVVDEAVDAEVEALAEGLVIPKTALIFCASSQRNSFTPLISLMIFGLFLTKKHL